MAVDKKIQPEASKGFVPAQEEAIGQMVEMQVQEGLQPEVEMLDDGSAIVGEQENIIPTNFDMNLAEVLDDDELGNISSELRQCYEDDKSSRQEWEETYKKGLDLLGFKYQERTMPFAGASSVTHPMLSEAITQFQAQAYKELLPAGGPVNTQIIGALNPAKESQAQRVKDYMNYQIMHEMEEYDPDLESLLFYRA